MTTDYTTPLETVPSAAAQRPNRRPTMPREAGPLQWILIPAACLVLVGVLVLPLLVVFYYAFLDGWRAYVESVVHRETWLALKLTFITAIIAVPLNTLFGIAAAWCVTRYRFFGRSFLLTLIDLPFAVSPVVAGLALVVIFHRQGAIGQWLDAHDIRVIYALPGIILATIFITFPFVARELIPLMEAQGTEEEEAAHSLGANGWQIFWRVTVPNIKWGLVYGIILCNARAVGEFGAVHAVTSNQEDQMTIPLLINDLYMRNLASVSPAFAVATLLAIVGLFTLITKTILEWRHLRALKQTLKTTQNDAA